MAAGEGTRLRPLTERWPKPVLPIDGQPVVVTLVHELAAAGCERIVIVTGHLAEQVEALLEPLPYAIEFVRQPEPLGSADAVVRANARPPFLVSAADTRFADGDLRLFAERAGDLDGAIAIRRQAGRPASTYIHIEDGRVLQVHGSPRNDEWTAAPLWWISDPVARFLDPLPGKPPYELADVVQAAIDSGVHVSAIQIGGTRDLTTPLDLVRENFDYLR
jgi:UDP-N-acetylglucosamine diphosphorylase / glucose-1-phosphate thymidylyltransferase / UDP-N-acetylgalactosamine diphosphorylase / glucosamine-1-phosphate N-acetyltransferase / galactosamine-1-phosphate N-acetyltransferase